MKTSRKLGASGPPAWEVDAAMVVFAPRRSTSSRAPRYLSVLLSLGTLPGCPPLADVATACAVAGLRLVCCMLSVKVESSDAPPSNICTVSWPSESERRSTTQMAAPR
ncbi:hypothetical protein PSPO01_02869 [Paraphaeosphaeria sporulosa]